MGQDYSEVRVPLPSGALADWTVEARPGGPPETAHGKCPLCGDACETEIQVVIVSGGVAAKALVEVEPPKTLTRQFICDCTGEHAKRPPGIARGCGRWWLATVVRDSDGTYSIGPAVDDSMLTIATEMTAAFAAEQDEVRGSAKNWLAGVAALYGVFGLTGIAVGKDSVSGLTDQAKACVGLAVLLGVLAAACAVLCSYQAAYGWPHAVSVANDEEQRAWHRERQEYLVIAAERLRLSVMAGVGALLSLVVATAIIWFAPAAAAPTPTVTLVGRDGSQPCGVLLSSDGPGAVRVRRTDGSVVSMSAPNLTKITVGPCPS